MSPGVYVKPRPAAIYYEHPIREEDEVTVMLPGSVALAELPAPTVLNGVVTSAGAQARKPDLALVDIRLPDRDGFDVLACELEGGPQPGPLLLSQLRAQHPDAVRILLLEEGQDAEAS